MKNILTIAGYDPSSGAGVTKDLDVFLSLGFHGIALPTSIVIQGPGGVKGVFPVPEEQFSLMLAEAGKEIALSGVKIGVVWDRPQVNMIAPFLRNQSPMPVVLDPVFRAKNGRALLSEAGIEGLKDLLFPVVTLLTPNTEEASVLTGMSVTSPEDMEESARRLVMMGPKAVVIKGGHLRGEPVDILYDGQGFTRWQRKRSDKTIHGTGCIFSSLLVSFLAGGYVLQEAFLAAEERMDDLLKGGYRIDKEGYHYASPSLLNSRDGERFRALAAMKQARDRLLELNPVDLVAGTEMNMGFAIPGAKDTRDVAVFPEPIEGREGRFYVSGEPVFGATSPVAPMILAAMACFPFVRSAVNLRYRVATIQKAKEQGMDVIFFDRTKESETIKKWKDESLDFIVNEALKKVENPPDLIYDVGDVENEPMIRLFARNPLELMTKMEKIKS